MKGEMMFTEHRFSPELCSPFGGLGTCEADAGVSKTLWSIEDIVALLD